MTRIIVGCILVVLSHAICSAETYLHADDHGQVQARLRNTPVSEVQALLEQNFDIQVSGTETISQDQLTLTFENLDLERALKRIFSKINYAIIYDSRGEVVEVMLFPKGGIPTLKQKSNRNRERLSNNFVEIWAQKSASLQTLKHLDADQPADHVLMVPDNEASISEQEDFKVVPNTSPDEAFRIDPKSIPTDGSFKVVINSPPSGNDFQIVPSAPPSRK